LLNRLTARLVRLFEISEIFLNHLVNVLNCAFKVYLFRLGHLRDAITMDAWIHNLHRNQLA
jgi:hypothetical protein